MKLNWIKHSVASLALAGVIAMPPVSALAKDSSALEMARQLNRAFIELADTVSPSVVVISVAHKPLSSRLWRSGEEDGTHGFEGLPDELRRQFERWMEGRRPNTPDRGDSKDKDSDKDDEPNWNGQGSGVIVRDDGYIITNNHVIDGAEKVRVRLKDGREFDAEIRGRDDKSDLAVLKIKGDVTGLQAAKFADSAKVRVGEFAIAIGAPFELDYSVTFGHVSAKGRSRITGNRTADEDFIQTDANINPGNSGGPLVNIEGEVIGINAMIRGLRTGIGFAIPANIAKQVSDSIIENGRFARPWLGIEMSGIKENPEYRSMSKRGVDGVVVASIVPEGPASKSELKVGDIITAIDGKPVTSSQELRNEVRSKRVGSQLNLDVLRQKKNVKVKVKTEEWPDDGIPVVNKKSSQPEATESELGITVKSLTKELAEEFGVDEREGVIVTSLEPTSIAARKNVLQRGDVITEVNQEKVTSPKEFKEALKNASLKEGAMLTVVSKDQVARLKVLKERSE